MSNLHIGDPGLSPAAVYAYIEDMLLELAVMAERLGDPSVSPSIRAAASVAQLAQSRCGADAPRNDHAA